MMDFTQMSLSDLVALNNQLTRRIEAIEQKDNPCLELLRNGSVITQVVDEIGVGEYDVYFTIDGKQIDDDDGMMRHLTNLPVCQRLGWVVMTHEYVDGASVDTYRIA